jgi:hypothetical protein
MCVKPLRGCQIIVCQTAPWFRNECFDLSLDYTVDRANVDALGRIVMAYAFDTYVGIDDVNCITFTDRLGRAFWLASPTRDALICNFHGHRGDLLLFF